jgi:hypothetical protein
MNVGEPSLGECLLHLERNVQFGPLVLLQCHRGGSNEEYRAVSAVYENNSAVKKALEDEIASLDNQGRQIDLDAEVNAALGQIEHLEDLAQKAEDLAVAREILDLINANLFLRFDDAKWGKRTVRKVAGGVLTTGAAPLPIQPYQGRTSSKEIKTKATQAQVAIEEVRSIRARLPWQKAGKQTR